MIYRLLVNNWLMDYSNAEAHRAVADPSERHEVTGRRRGSQSSSSSRMPYLYSWQATIDAIDVMSKMKSAGISLHMIDLGDDIPGNGVSKLVFTIFATVAEAERDPVHQGGRGRERNWMTDPDAKLVHFGADYIHCTRSISLGLWRA